MAAEERIRFDERIVEKFIWATVIWGVVGMLVGVLIAVQIFMPAASFGIPWTTFGRLRPLHTNAVIFAFCGNAIFAGIYYSTQRLLKARMGSDLLSQLHFWGWQLIIVAAAITLPLGITTSKEYAELEWPIDIAITLVWVIFGLNLILTILKRREPTLYVSIWFYLATFLTVAMLHVVNSLNLPLSLWKSYPIFKGAQDALVQWWYGHNAVAFFLTTPFLGLAYYFIPKAVNKPIYSYRLSIIHFWSLVFIYIWAGPHHLLYSSLPEWLQSLGMVFSVMLLAPSWGGAINFVLTLRNAWDQLKSQPIPKFLAAATTFYMMSTFEGPLLSIKSVNALSHATDWTVGHVHSGALGWNGLLIFGMCYYLFPRLYRTTLYSNRLATTHFWVATIGIAMYIVSMWISGAMQGVMSNAMDASGALRHPNYLEIVTAILPLHWVRATGGSLYFLGVLLMCYNLYKTAAQGTAVEDPEITVPALPASADSLPVTPESNKFLLRWQNYLEHRGLLFAVAALIAVSVGGLVQITPLLLSTESAYSPKILPLTALEQEGRDIYVREGCNNCHTQQVRPILGETLRYGPYSRMEESQFDTPHLWGSKRTGPDLARAGTKYGHLWHWRHMKDPQSTSPGSVMPPYPWLANAMIRFDSLPDKLKTLRQLGIPYNDEAIANAAATARTQANTIATAIAAEGESVNPDSELIALIAYLQRLGTDFRNQKPEMGASK